MEVEALAFVLRDEGSVDRQKDEGSEKLPEGFLSVPKGRSYLAL